MNEVWSKYKEQFIDSWLDLSLLVFDDFVVMQQPLFFGLMNDILIAYQLSNIASNERSQYILPGIPLHVKFMIPEMFSQNDA